MRGLGQRPNVPPLRRTQERERANSREAAMRRAAVEYCSNLPIAHRRFFLALENGLVSDFCITTKFIDSQRVRRIHA